MLTGGTRRVAAAGLAFTLAFAACSGSDADDAVVPLTAADTTTTTAAPTTTTTVATTTTAAPTTTTAAPTTSTAAEPVTPTIDQLEEIIRAERDALLDALAEDGDKSGVGLAGLVTADRLALLTNQIAEREADGLATRRASIETVDVIELVESEADGILTAIACFATDAVIYEVGTGNVVDDDLIYLVRLVTFSDVNGSWLVASQRRLDSGPTEEVCALDS